MNGHNLFHVPENMHFRDAVAAIITLDDGRYLMQLRDDKAGIFYPDHWGLFGGAVDPGESPEDALRRELMEELELTPDQLHYFTRMDFDVACFGRGTVYRIYYEVPIAASVLPSLQLGEGRLMQALSLSEILLGNRVVPYDSFAVWLHYAARGAAGSTAAPQGDRGQFAVGATGGIRA
jgi:8-oxo-dGTP pyrophosphatase MutT (NUDIX family)